MLHLAGPLVDGAAADVVAVFGQVGQVAEVGECPDHAHGLVAGELFQQFFQIAVGLAVVVAAKCHRELADLLDQFERLFAFLLPDHVAQNAAQQPNVFDQGQVLVGHGGGASARGRELDAGAGAVGAHEWVLSPRGVAAFLGRWSC